MHIQFQSIWGKKKTENCFTFYKNVHLIFNRRWVLDIKFHYFCLENHLYLNIGTLYETLIFPFFSLMNFILVLKVNLALRTFSNTVISTELTASAVSLLQYSVSYMAKQRRNETQLGN